MFGKKELRNQSNVLDVNRRYGKENKMYTIDFDLIERMAREMTRKVDLNNKGSKNCNWKGGIFEYPNHHKMKRNRLIKLKQQKEKCEICGKKAKTIHHLDKSKNNHNIKNLILVCCHCHFSILHKGCHGRPRGSKNKGDKK